MVFEQRDMLFSKISTANRKELQRRLRVFRQNFELRLRLLRKQSQLVDKPRTNITFCTFNTSSLLWLVCLKTTPRQLGHPTQKKQLRYDIHLFCLRLVSELSLETTPTDIQLRKYNSKTLILSRTCLRVELQDNSDIQLRKKDPKHLFCLRVVSRDNSETTPKSNSQKKNKTLILSRTCLWVVSRDNSQTTEKQTSVSNLSGSKK